MRKEINSFEYVCDVCGEKANGSFSRTERTNGEISLEFDSSYILDLCDKHARIFSYIVDDLPPRLLMDRYDDRNVSDSDKQNVIKLIKEKQGEL